TEQYKRPWICHIAGSTVEEEQHRVGTVLAANGDPLLNASDGYVARLVDALCRVDGDLFRVAGAEKRQHSVQFAILRIKCLEIFRIRWVRSRRNRSRRCL